MKRNNIAFYIFFALVLITGSDVISARTTTHREPNGFTWIENSEPIRRDNPREGNYVRASDTSYRDLFGRTRGVTFHCLGANDEGQFTVTQKVKSEYRYTEGLYSRDGRCILAPESGPTKFKERIRIGNDYGFIALYIDKELKSRFGVIDDKGKLVIPYSYSRLTNQLYNGKRSLENFLLAEKETGCQGLVRFDGSFIIYPENDTYIHAYGPFIESSSPTKGRTLITYDGEILVENARGILDMPSESRLRITMPDGNIGFMGYDGSWILSPDAGYSEFLTFTDDSDKTFYKVKKNGRYGVLDSSRKAVLPCEFENIEYIGGNLFKFKSGDFWGVVNSIGKVIIPTSRGYDSIGRYSSIQKTIPFTKAGDKGECNSKGTVIVLHKAPRTQRSTAGIFPNLPDGKYKIVSLILGGTEIAPKNTDNYIVLSGKKITVILGGVQQSTATVTSVPKGSYSLSAKAMSGGREITVDVLPYGENNTILISLDNTGYVIRK